MGSDEDGASKFLYGYDEIRFDLGTFGSPYKAMQVRGIGKNYAHNVLILLERTYENVGRKSLKLLTCIVL